MQTKILDIIGQSKSGKTTIAFDLANRLDKENKKTIIISYNQQEPLSHFIKDYTSQAFL